MAPVEYLIHEIYAEKSASVWNLKCAKEFWEWNQSSANRQLVATEFIDQIFDFVTGLCIQRRPACLLSRAQLL
jgi:hypothetical protein